MFGNKLFFLCLTYMDSLPSITLAYESQTKCQGIGQINPISTLSLDFVFRFPFCTFNLIFINKLNRTLPYSVTLSNYYVLVLDQSTRTMIVVWHESQGLYYLFSPITLISCSVVESSYVVKQCLVHPRL